MVIGHVYGPTFIRDICEWKNDECRTVDMSFHSDTLFRDNYS